MAYKHNRLEFLACVCYIGCEHTKKKRFHQNNLTKIELFFLFLLHLGVQCLFFISVCRQQYPFASRDFNTFLYGYIGAVDEYILCC